MLFYFSCLARPWGERGVWCTIRYDALCVLLFYSGWCFGFAFFLEMETGIWRLVPGLEREMGKERLLLVHRTHTFGVFFDLYLSVSVSSVSLFLFCLLVCGFVGALHYIYTGLI